MLYAKRRCIMCQKDLLNSPRVSVAMAVYNGELYLQEQIDSILCQLRTGDELVISVDPSTDRTLEILSKYAVLDTRVKFFYNKHRLGVVRNFQNALEHTSGDIIFYSDQDDVWMHDKVKTVLKEFENENVSVVIHDSRLVDENLNVLNNSTFELRGGARTSIVGNLIRLSYIGCAMAFRAKYKEVIIPIPTIYRSHDWWTGTICGACGRMIAIHKPLINHRIHGKNVTPKSRPSLYYQLQVRWIILLNLLRRYRHCMFIKKL